MVTELKHWNKIKIREAFQTTRKPSTLNWKVKANIPFIPMANINEGGGQISKFDFRTANEISSATYFEKGDFLLSKITPCFENLKQGFCDLLPDEYGFTSTEIIPIKGINNIGDVQFLSYFLLKKAVRNDLAEKMVGTTGRQRLTKESLLNYEILLPSLKEQKTIAKVLCTIQDAIEIRKKEFKLQRELKDTLMAHLFTHGTKNEPLKETEIGLIPESWKLVKISEIAEVKSGGTPSRANPEYWNGSIPWVKTGEINYSIITETSEKISLVGLNNSAAKIIPKNTILVAMYGQGITRGRVAVLGVDAAVNQACAALINIDIKIKEFIYFFLEFSYNRLRNLGHGANQKNLNADIVKRFKCPRPSCENECAQISNILYHCSQKILLIEKEISHFEELFQAMLEELMTGKISTMPLVENCERAS